MSYQEALLRARDSPANPHGRLLKRLMPEILREFSKQKPDLVAIAALLKAYGVVPVVTSRQLKKSRSRHSVLRLGPATKGASPLRVDATQFHFSVDLHQLLKGHRAWMTPPRVTLSFGNSWKETLKWSRLLADAPQDAMGDEHFRLMGRFQSYGHAAPDSFEEVALDAFEQRLALSRKYGTWFSEQVSPGWRGGNPRKHYLERWSGTYDRLVWSFGIQGHPRADQIWHLMKERLPQDPDEVTRTFPEDVSDIEVALRPETVAVRSWTFPYHGLLYSIYEDRRGNFFLCHTKSCDIRDIVRPRLTALWNATLNRDRQYTERLESLAEFEWLWYWTNPFVRGGATTGGVLSVFLQRSLLHEGLHINIPDHFVMQDLYALSSEWRFYVRERVAHLSAGGARAGMEDGIEAPTAAIVV
ncbi:hypothetical protein GGS20DRAFT_568398 [Poronia punctata]|nr:hypothetical protein GGS20DRAFT_568398 [Poronia punctata]